MVILQPGLIQGIDYYLLTSSVWTALRRIYRADVECLVVRSSGDIPRPRLPTNASISDTEIGLNESSVESVSIDINAYHSSSQSIQKQPIPCLIHDKSVITLSRVIPCVVCGNDSIMRCGKSKRCYYCSKACYDIHYPYHHSMCEQSLEDQYHESESVMKSPSVLPSYVRSELIREGIINSGNTCFLASTVQCLFTVKQLRHLLMSDQYLRYLLPDVSFCGCCEWQKKDPGCVTSSLSNVFRDLRFRRSSVHIVVMPLR